MKHGHHMTTKAKAKEILRHGEVKGKPLSEKQKGLFGLVAGGGTPTRLKKKKRHSSERIRKALGG